MTVATARSGTAPDMQLGSAASRAGLPARPWRPHRFSFLTAFINTQLGLPARRRVLPTDGCMLLSTRNSAHRLFTRIRLPWARPTSAVALSTGVLPH